jgi:hypothetical protein
VTCSRYGVRLRKRISGRARVSIDGRTSGLESNSFDLMLMLCASPVSSTLAHSSSLLVESPSGPGTESAEKKFSKSVSKPDDDLCGATTVSLGRLMANVDE